MPDLCWPAMGRNEMEGAGGGGAFLPEGFEICVLIEVVEVTVFWRVASDL